MKNQKLHELPKRRGSSSQIDHWAAHHDVCWRVALNWHLFPPPHSPFFKKWIRSDGLHSSLDARFCLLFLFFSCVWMISTLVWTGRCAIKMSSIDQCNSVCVCPSVWYFSSPQSSLLYCRDPYNLILFDIHIKNVFKKKARKHHILYLSPSVFKMPIKNNFWIEFQFVISFLGVTVEEF